MKFKGIEVTVERLLKGRWVEVEEWTAEDDITYIAADPGTRYRVVVRNKLSLSNKAIRCDVDGCSVSPTNWVLCPGRTSCITGFAKSAAHSSWDNVVPFVVGPLQAASAGAKGALKPTDHGSIVITAYNAYKVDPYEATVAVSSASPLASSKKVVANVSQKQLILQSVATLLPRAADIDTAPVKEVWHWRQDDSHCTVMSMKYVDSLTLAAMMASEPVLSSSTDVIDLTHIDHITDKHNTADSSTKSTTGSISGSKRPRSEAGTVELVDLADDSAVKRRQRQYRVAQYIRISVCKNDGKFIAVEIATPSAVDDVTIPAVRGVDMLMAELITRAQKRHNMTVWKASSALPRVWDLDGREIRSFSSMLKSKKVFVVGSSSSDVFKELRSLSHPGKKA